MSNVTTALSPRQASKLAVLVDALDSVTISDGERASLTWLTGCEAHTVENTAAVITHARAAELRRSCNLDLRFRRSTHWHLTASGTPPSAA
ncbi:MAG: hypothetical protein ACRDRA_20165 [Pseudonocardiaceae bacterium]